MGGFVNSNKRFARIKGVISNKNLGEFHRDFNFAVLFVMIIL